MRHKRLGYTIRTAVSGLKSNSPLPSEEGCLPELLLRRERAERYRCCFALLTWAVVTCLRVHLGCRVFVYKQLVASLLHCTLSSPPTLFRQHTFSTPRSLNTTLAQQCALLTAHFLTSTLSHHNTPSPPHSFNSTLSQRHSLPPCLPAIPPPDSYKVSRSAHITYRH